MTSVPFRLKRTGVTVAGKRLVHLKANPGDVNIIACKAQIGVLPCCGKF